MIDWLGDNLGSDLLLRLLGSVAVVVFALLLRSGILRALRGRMEDMAAFYRARKVVGYVATLLAALVLARIWLVRGGFTDVVTFLGLLSAGVAIALSDLLKNMAGWAYIVLRRPFWLGDRIQVGPQGGDVIDIRLFRFTMLEIGNWVDADQSTGRIVHVPNGKVFTEAVANYTQGFEFIWHEIPVLITFESDWHRAEAVLRRVLEEHAPETAAIGAAERIRQAARAYLIHYTHLTPTVYLTVRDSGVLLTGRVLVPARQRRGIEDAVWRAVLTAFGAEDGIELAYPTVRTYLRDAVPVTGVGTSAGG